MNNENSWIGIDAIAFHGPECYVDMAELAKARGIDPAKYQKGLGQLKMAVATPCEDTVTMAAQAGRKALDKFDVDASEIGMLIIGTETGIDHSKPAAVYVHELLGLPQNCRTFETKHACYGATAGMTSAIDWIAAGRARGKKALVIASDIARYGIGTPGEPTQGAGAVAMVISDEARLVAINSEAMGDYTRQVMDFWRPLYSKYAFTDGHYSIECYLDALSGAWEAARENAADKTRFALESIDACFYHVPFTAMARKAHFRHWEIDQDVVKTNKDVSDEYAQQIMLSYQKRVSPWLSINAEVGNIYTGSLFLALMDYLRQNENSSEANISLFSYGSGCGASYCLASVHPDAAQFARLCDPSEELNNRRKLSVTEYETVIKDTENTDLHENENLDPTQWNLSDNLRYLGTRNHQRVYVNSG
ncbi:MAG: hydroxymethylglutaryl-CoA synthase [Gammaproteobacteria bacterium]|nr:hydroxymethylglutaryl-CoA synthase [Gammaproteobacteria bacterium]